MDSLGARRLASREQADDLELEAAVSSNSNSLLASSGNSNAHSRRKARVRELARVVPRGSRGHSNSRSQQNPCRAEVAQEPLQAIAIGAVRRDTRRPIAGPR